MAVESVYPVPDNQELTTFDWIYPVPDNNGLNIFDLVYILGCWKESFMK